MITHPYRAPSALLTALASLSLACSSGQALTPAQEKKYHELQAKHEAVQKERASLHQRLEQQFRENSAAEKKRGAVVKDVAACKLKGSRAQLSLKSFKKRPSQVSFKRGGSAKKGCEALQAQVKR